MEERQQHPARDRGSQRRQFFEYLCLLAHNGQWEALERIEREAEDILAVCLAKLLLKAGWEQTEGREGWD